MDSATTGRSPQAVVLPVLSSIAVVVSIPPIILHWKNRNFPATALIGWFLLINTFNIINALIWPTDDVDSWWDGHGLCDVETKVMIASYVGIPGTLVCIFRSLASVLDTRSAMLVPSIGQRWRDRLMDFSFCVIGEGKVTVFHPSEGFAGLISEHCIIVILLSPHQGALKAMAGLPQGYAFMASLILSAVMPKLLDGSWPCGFVAVDIMRDVVFLEDVFIMARQARSIPC